MVKIQYTLIECNCITLNYIMLNYIKLDPLVIHGCLSNGKKYFLLHFSRTETRNGQEYTPQVNLYLSPSQIRDFLEILDQEYLNSQVQELREKAYNY